MIRSAILAIPLLAAAGCAGPHFDHVEMSVTSDAPADAIVGANGVQVTEGEAVRVTIRAIDSDGARMDASIDAGNPNVLGVYLTTEADDSYVLAGVSTGTAAIHVVNRAGDEVATIPATVVAPH